MFGATAPFAVNAINTHWDLISSQVPSDWLPRAEPPKPRQRKPVFREFGCGHYGCVFPTGRTDLVLKITTDQTEAAFIAAALEIGEFPAGIVRYHKMISVPTTYRGRTIFFIWREEAFNVGEDAYSNAVRNDRYRWDARTKYFAKRLREFKGFASVVRDSLRRTSNRDVALQEVRDLADWAFRMVSLEDIETPGWDKRGSERLRRLRGPYRVAAYLRGCEIIAEMMENEPEGDRVGSALAFYLEHNILLADVHANNIGEVRRSGQGEFLVITDPGHAVFL